MTIFDKYESEVRGYCRSFPVVFDKAEGSYLIDEDGNRYLDFFAGAGVLNYGHNRPELKEKLLEYLSGNGVVHSLDMYSVAKRHFLERFHDVILEPRGMNYKVQFPGPTGTNAVEAALKLARKVTGRENVVAFTNAFHGMTLGALAVTGNEGKRHSAAQTLQNGTLMPFDGYLGERNDTLDYFEHALEDRGSGLEMPAAAIVETVQAEGGVNVARMEWLQRLARICEKHGILLIIDDIQVGCGRTGTFFSFEKAGIKPDIITLSKSLSGYGLPFSVVLIKPEHDIWEPGEHNGTFRGHNPAFVTAAAGLDHFWTDDTLTRDVETKSKIVEERLNKIARDNPSLKASVRGRGFIQGLVCGLDGAAEQISEECFKRGLIIETSGINDQVVKFLAPLTISEEDLAKGLDIIGEAARTVAGKADKQSRSVA
ncbi:MAG: diaminobutyrate--2-oxoglutarate transaminase [Gammaproteobacteria bacterium]|jgi:diaminobutyrate-2-oxoglutarate transaminase